MWRLKVLLSNKEINKISGLIDHISNFLLTENQVAWRLDFDRDIQKPQNVALKLCIIILGNELYKNLKILSRTIN